MLASLHYSFNYLETIENPRGEPLNVTQATLAAPAPRGTRLPAAQRRPRSRSTARSPRRPSGPVSKKSNSPLTVTVLPVGLHAGIDVAELGIAVGVLAAFQALAVALPGVVEFAEQQLAHAGATHRMTHLRQPGDQLVEALGKGIIYLTPSPLSARFCP